MRNEITKKLEVLFKDNIKVGFESLLDYIASKEKIGKACLHGKKAELDVFDEIYEMLKLHSSDISVMLREFFNDQYKGSIYCDRRGLEVKNNVKMGISNGKVATCFVAGIGNGDILVKLKDMNKNIKIFASTESTICFKMALITAHAKGIEAKILLDKNRTNIRYSLKDYKSERVNLWPN